MNKIYKKIYFKGVLGLFLGAVFACSEEEPVSLAPTFNMSEASDILRTSATFSGSISGETSHIKEYGFDYSLSEDFTTNLTTRVKVGESLSSSFYQVNVKGLEANERYYYRMYATTGVSTVFSPSEYFQTSASSAPIMSALVVDSIGEDMARFKCTIEEIGDEYLIEYGVGYKTAAERTYYQVPSDSIIPVSIAGAENTFYIEISGLESATKYSFRPYAKNSADANGDSGTREGYGEIVERQTANKLSAMVTTSEIMEGQVGINSVTVSGMVQSADGSGGKIDKCGFCWSPTNMTPSIADSHMEVKVTGVGEYFSATIPDLQPGRTYYVRAYAQNTVDGVAMVGYGDVYEFTTTNLVTPVLQWVTSTNENGYEVEYNKVTTTTISVRANIKEYDGTALVEKGVIWDKSRGQLSIEEARMNGTYMKIESGENMIDATIKDLEMNTGYYIRAYAIYQAAGLEEIGYSSTLTLRTQDFERPNLEGLDVQEITYNSAKLIGHISSNGNGTIIERGFCISLHSDVYNSTIEDCDLRIVSDETFTSVAKGLEINTSYTASSYVICTLESQTDTIYGGRYNFWTNDVQRPDMDLDWQNVDIKATTAKITMVIGDLGDGEIVEQGFCWYLIEGDEYISASLENCIGSIVVKDGTEKGFSGTITGLIPDTWYSYAAYMKMKVGDTEYIAYRDFGTNTGSFYIDINISDVTANSFKVTGFINDDIPEGVTEYGFCWSSNEGELISEMPNQIKASTPNANGEFVATIGSLVLNTRYFVGVYVIYKGKKIYANGWQEVTLRIPEINDIPSPEIKN